MSNAARRGPASSVDRTVFLSFDPLNPITELVQRLSALIHNYGNILAVIFIITWALSVEWIRLLISFIGQDLQD